MDGSRRFLTGSQMFNDDWNRARHSKEIGTFSEIL